MRVPRASRSISPPGGKYDPLPPAPPCAPEDPVLATLVAERGEGLFSGLRSVG